MTVNLAPDADSSAQGQTGWAFARFGEPDQVLERVAGLAPAPGPGQVRLRMLAAPVHASDLHVLRGRYGRLPALPASPGLEGVGVVDATGQGADDALIGQRVVPLLEPWGAWRGLLLVDADRVVPVPADMTDSTAAQLVVNPLSALVMLTRELHPEPGQWLLQTAADGTVGRLVQQLAAHLSIRTINVVRRPEQAERLRATVDPDQAAVVCTATDDLPARVRELTDAAGVPYALDCVAGELGAQVARCLAPGGTQLIYGALSTHRQTGPAALTTPLVTPGLIYRAVTVRGWWLYQWLDATPLPEVRQALVDVAEHVQAGRLTIAPGQAYDATQAGAVAAACAAAEHPGREGKPLLTWPAS